VNYGLRVLISASEVVAQPLQFRFDLMRALPSGVFRFENGLDLTREIRMGQEIGGLGANFDIDIFTSTEPSEHFKGFAKDDLPLLQLVLQFHQVSQFFLGRIVGFFVVRRRHFQLEINGITDRETMQAESLTKWDKAIEDAESGLQPLRRAIETCRDMKAKGMPWPGSVPVASTQI